MDKHEEKHKNSLPFQIDYTSKFNNTFRRKFHEQFMDKETSPDEFAILGFLVNEPNISQNRIGKILFKGKAHIGKILHEMERKRLITRELLSNNSFKNIVTPKGKQIFECGIDTIEKNIVAKFKKEFSTEEHELFIKFLERYRNVMKSIVDVKLK